MTSPSSFSDLAPLLQAALREGGARVQLDRPADATQLRQRIYRYRKAMGDAAQAAGYPSTTPYDSMLVTIDQRTCEVVIQFRSPNFNVRTLDGRPLELPAQTETPQLGGVGQPPRLSPPTTGFSPTEEQQLLDAIRNFRLEPLDEADGVDIDPLDHLEPGD